MRHALDVPQITTSLDEILLFLPIFMTISVLAIHAYK